MKITPRINLPDPDASLAKGPKPTPPEDNDEMTKLEKPRTADAAPADVPQPSRPLSDDEKKAWSGAIELARPPRQLNDMDYIC